MHGCMVGVSHLFTQTHAQKNTEMHAQTKRKNKYGAGFYSRTLPKFTQSSELCCQISLQCYNVSGDKSAIKQERATTEHYAQAAAHYLSLPLSRHTHKCSGKKTNCINT